MQAQKTYLEFQVRDISLLSSVNSYAELQANWASSGHLSKATLQNLAIILTPTGGSITYVSQSWHEVGIAGMLGVLATLNAFRLDVLVGAAPAAPPVSKVLHLDLTPDQWTKLAALLAGAGAVLITITGGAGVVPVALLAVGTGSFSLTTVVSVLGLTLTAEGVAAGSLGLYESIVSNPSANVCASPPSGGIINLPIDASDAGSDVLSTTATPDAYVGYTSPAVDTNNLPTVPPPPMPSGSGPTPVPTSGPTPVPTSGPTPVPTSGPTPVPTSGPTPVPTSGPTPVPTSGPTPTLPPPTTFAP